jgi:hypothetical protein
MKVTNHEKSSSLSLPAWSVYFLCAGSKPSQTAPACLSRPHAKNGTLLYILIPTFLCKRQQCKVFLSCAVASVPCIFFFFSFLCECHFRLFLFFAIFSNKVKQEAEELTFLRSSRIGGECLFAVSSSVRPSVRVKLLEKCWKNLCDIL